MTTDTAALRLLEAWRQCQRHLHHLMHAQQALQPWLPMQPGFLARLDDEAVQDWDQFILRFTKLQDAMGGRLLPSVLAFLQEPYEDRPMLDKLNRLEKLGYLDHAETWHTLRAIRNRFAHDYPEDDALKAAYLNEAVAAVPLLQTILSRVDPLVAQAQAESQ